MSTGKVVQIIGAVVDVEFPQDAVPQVYDALNITEGDLKRFSTRSTTAAWWRRCAYYRNGYLRRFASWSECRKHR